MGRAFFSVDAWGLDHLRGALAQGPVLLLPNHSNWWDGFVDLLLERRLGADLRVMMDAANLSANPFLRWLGAFDAKLDSPRGAALALRHASRLLAPTAPGAHPRLLVLYPQGSLASPRTRPLAVKPGAEWLLRTAPHASAIPCARAYEFLGEDRPQVFLRFGNPLRHATTEAIRAALEGELDTLLAELNARRTDGAERLLQGPLSLNKRWERRARRLTIGRRRPFEPFNPPV
jgi:1-acyl-sn-glycerol-3-phosphate acyltransferase